MKKRRILLTGTAVLLILAGVWQSGQKDVMNKATRICLECIGIG
ncbi:CD1871A family CXXC motif-containing protein [Lachnoclostridium sp. An181]|nr:CD1871A family CXXC motif-containing protein [Lachnoclostridium sp. An181]